MIDDAKQIADYLVEADNLVVDCVQNEAFGILLVGKPNGEFRMISLNSDYMEARLLVECALAVMREDLQERTLQ